MATEKLAIVQQKIDLLRHAIDSGAAAELKKQELLAQNAALRAQIEDAVAKLTTLEVANGKKQYPVPKRAKVEETKAAPVKAVKKEAAATAEAPKVDAAKQAEQKAKKEAKKAAKAGNKKPQAGGQPERAIDLSRVKLIVGEIVHVERHPDAEGLYVEKMECGEAEPRQVISGLVKHVPIESMKRKVCMIANLKPAKMRGITSYGMVLCAKTGEKPNEKVELIRVPDCAVAGDIITTDDFLGDNWQEPDSQMNPKKKIFEQVQPDFATTNGLVATWKGKPLLIKGKEEQTRGRFVSDSIKGGQIS